MPKLFAIKSEPLRQFGMTLAAADRVNRVRRFPVRSPSLAVVFQQFDSQADVGAGNLEAQGIKGGNIFAKRIYDLYDARLRKGVFPRVFNHRATDLPEAAKRTSLQFKYPSEIERSADESKKHNGPNDVFSRRRGRWANHWRHSII